MRGVQVKTLLTRAVVTYFPRHKLSPRFVQYRIIQLCDGGTQVCVTVKGYWAAVPGWKQMLCRLLQVQCSSTDCSAIPPVSSLHVDV